MKTRVNLDTEDGFNATVMSDDGTELATVYDRDFFRLVKNWHEADDFRDFLSQAIDENNRELFELKQRLSEDRQSEFDEK